VSRPVVQEFRNNAGTFGASSGASNPLQVVGMTQKYVQVWGTFAATNRMERKRQLSRDITDVQLIMRSICDKWALLLLHQLSLGKKRHGELHRAPFGISEKMLTQTLRKLERDGLVQRTIHPVVPPHVDYALTRLGSTLTALLHTLYR
jgi:DNA-binding HxlR family transcriptional regulator